ncbi:hypothetical protein F5877DRAFT_74651 [Lentinula edodes]|nr:hypothetical protein F5877DRAFT_74651 [Lentinula edodes]
MFSLSTLELTSSFRLNDVPEPDMVVRRTRKELFVDNNAAICSEPPLDNAQYIDSNPNPVFDPHASLGVGTVANIFEAPGQIDPMDVWRTYTKRSADDKNGRAPLTCLWPIRHNEEEIIECGYGATPKLMRRHVQTTHMHIKRYRCDICDQAFSQGALLHSHKASKQYVFLAKVEMISD